MSRPHTASVSDHFRIIRTTQTNAACHYLRHSMCHKAEEFFPHITTGLSEGYHGHWLLISYCLLPHLHLMVAKHSLNLPCPAT